MSVPRTAPTAHRAPGGEPPRTPAPQDPPAGPDPLTDPAGDVVRWAVFSCALVPLVLLWYGTSLAGAAGTALGLAAVTAVCRLLLRRAERCAALTGDDPSGHHPDPHPVPHPGHHLGQRAGHHAGQHAGHRAESHPQRRRGGDRSSG
ncbi:hypothetical protein AB0D49_27380 [Streptomyces sp. NPDC048290]|uniref:hypothetical protein n=1 Tax=Streptomyces sp. NPDC048290 TaxID=3155811 RepID=UPI0034125297